MTETEASFPAPRGARWQAEPFRLFFPLGVVLGWVGIGHWLLYATGATSTYSCSFHALVQMQAFMMAFAVGFLLTAVPRRTQGPPPSALEMVALAGSLATIVGAAIAEHLVVQQIAYAALFVLLLQFAVRRFVGREAGRRPPAAFILIPIGVLHGLGGAVLIATGSFLPLPPYALTFGPLAVEQGVFLCFAIGVGSLVLPLMNGLPPPPDLGSSSRERWRLLAYAAAGITIFASLAGEAGGWDRAGPVLRAAVLVLTLGRQAGRRPGKPGLHRRLVWIAVWLMPLGLAASAVWPDYRVPALHMLFIGGFSLLAFAVATHVVLGHLDLPGLALGRPPAVAFLGVMLLLAMLARVSADWSDTYFEHLGWASGMWLAGSATWLAFLGPKLLRRGS